MTLQAVFFDMGGTIETFWYTRELRLEATPGIQQRLLSAGIDLGLDNQHLYELVADGLDHYHQWRLERLEELPSERIWREFILSGCPVDLSRLGSISEDLSFYLDTHYYQREMRPEMPAVLEEIRGLGIKIGLISNVSSRGQVPYNLEKYGLRHYFNPIVLSSEYGRRKPDPAIFHYAARLANVPAGACAYVGDRVTRDIDGARRAGFCLAIQVQHNFSHGESDAGAEPDALIEDMTELPGILRAEMSKTPERPASGGISAFLFDAGDILYYRPNKGSLLAAFLNDLGLSASSISLDQKEQVKERAFLGLIDIDEYHRELIQLYGVTQPEDIARGMQILDQEDHDIAITDGVKETLRALKARGFLLGIVTDNAVPVHTKLQWFEQAGFGDLWDSVVSSKELGVRKPGPPIYQAALNQLGVTPTQAVFVGHDANELRGARSVGMTTIAFNYDKSAQADYYIEKFPELIDLSLALVEKLEHIG